jgi:hypothetical protein
LRIFVVIGEIQVKYLEPLFIAFVSCVVAAVVVWSSQTPSSPVLTPSNAATPSARGGGDLVTSSPVIPVFQLPQDFPELALDQLDQPNPIPAPQDVFSSSSDLDAVAIEDWEPLPTDEPEPAVNPDDSFVPVFPQQFRVRIDPSNYGDRIRTDVNGKPLQNELLVVLHETSSSAKSAIHTFQTRHANEREQVSYHALILLDGRILYLVPPEKRAYGAGNSEFRGESGPEAVKTSPKFPSSVNNFAYHIALETPTDGQGKPAQTHSGYTLPQYDALVWLVTKLQVPPTRITTHRAIDRNRERSDPRSFDMDYFRVLLPL